MAFLSAAFISVWFISFCTYKNSGVFMRKLFIAMMLLLLSTFVFASAIESGDAGKSFAENLSLQMCLNSGIKAVYVCNGNVVKVVHTNTSRGSTFYKHDGAVINCPDVPASKMGALCVQMLLPNFCPNNSVCGTAPAQIFPGQLNTSVTPTKPVTPSQPIQNTSTQTPPTPPKQNDTTPASQQQNQSNTSTGSSQQTTTKKSGSEQTEDSTTLLAIMVAGIVLVAAINFFYFRGRR